MKTDTRKRWRERAPGVSAIAVGAVLAACGGDGGGAGGVDPFDPAVAQVAIEIDFETGQEPFTGPMAGFGDTFDLTAENIARLFGGKKQLAVPRTTAEMEDVGAIADEELTAADVLALDARTAGK